jgi:hypothetical protein
MALKRASNGSLSGQAGGLQQAKHAETDVLTTFVPRDPRVVEGPWNATDAALVQGALRDAASAAAPRTLTEQGEGMRDWEWRQLGAVLCGSLTLGTSNLLPLFGVADIDSANRNHEGSSKCQIK